MKNRVNNEVNLRRNGARKVKKFKLLIYFIIFQLFFGIATAPWIVYYGPFSTLKKMIVGQAMSTMSHQYIATLFLSQKQINDILYSNSNSNAGPIGSLAQDLNKIKIGNHDNNIELEKIDGKKFTGLMLVVHDPTRVKIGYSSQLGTVGQTTSQIAKNNNAIAAINGGGFQDKANNSTATWTGTGALPTGIIISGGKLIYPTDNIDYNVKRIGVAGITSNGQLIVGDHSINELLKDGVTEAICFGPTLIVNGTIQTRDSQGRPIDSQGANPRTAIGQRADGSILLLAIDGRQGLQMGATIGDVQKVMKDQGAINAVNLDGGASTTLYYNGSVQNNPSDKFGERPIPTAIYVK
ncbi:phosphodiester glycosidase family protein [Clostridium pasteurianum]|uniref:Exopolysaccharide biosynthesis protein n=1 Tax=Clostridium pasteurianum BC1 TaxID=86416 RepID=R4K2A3_CLOPA|nr:phosphodiester glycosidase family protein [Clostridium pasteurianum]AGK96703.1 exopolysaccharide biosynthesis protein [Clostridium pasteurianum BC1]